MSDFVERFFLTNIIVRVNMFSKLKSKKLNQKNFFEKNQKLLIK